MEGGFVIDTPEGIRAFGLLSLYHKLKMEVDNPHGPTWRGSPRMQALQVMGRADKPGKKKTLALYVEWLKERGIDVSV
jgi:hypothetical protein